MDLAPSLIMFFEVDICPKSWLLDTTKFSTKFFKNPKTWCFGTKFFKTQNLVLLELPSNTKFGTKFFKTQNLVLLEQPSLVQSFSKPKN